MCPSSSRSFSVPLSFNSRPNFSLSLFFSFQHCFSLFSTAVSLLLLLLFLFLSFPLSFFSLFTQTAETAGDAAAGSLSSQPTNQLTFSRQHSWWPVPWRFSRKSNLFSSFFLLILLLRFPLNLKCPFAAKFNYTLRGEHDTQKKLLILVVVVQILFPAAASLIIASEFLRHCGQKSATIFFLWDNNVCWLALKSFFIKSAHHHHHKVHNHHTELAKKQNREH